MTNKFKQECKKTTYKNRLGKIELDNDTISNSDYLASLEITDSCVSNGEILGNTNAKSIKIKTLDNYNLADKKIHPLIGIKYDDTSEEYIKMGNYTVDIPKDDKTAKNGEYNGIDDLNKLDQKYVCSIENIENCTILDFYKDVCKQIGLTPKKLEFINANIPVNGNPFTNNETCRIVLQNIAQVFCTFVDIDWETNEIDLIWFDDEYSETLTKNDYSTLEKNQVYGPINSLSIKESAIDGENVVIEQDGKEITDFIVQGKCEQKVVVSKNLYNYQDVNTKDNAMTIKEDGWVFVEEDNTNGAGEKYLNFWTNNLNLKENKNYNIICEVEVFENTYTNVDNTLVIANHHSGSNTGQFKNTMAYTINSLGKQATKQEINTTIENLKDVTMGLRSFITLRPGSKISLKFRISVLEDTTVTTGSFIYEPFVNESPTPNYPSEIKMVKGITNLFSSEMEIGSILGTGELQNNTNAIRTKDYIKINPNTNYIIKNSNRYTNNLYFYDIDKNLISSRTADKFTSSNNAYYLKVQSNAGNVQNDLNTIYQLEEGENSHSYVPYGCWLKTTINNKNLFNWTGIENGANVTADYVNQEVELNWTGGFNLYLLNNGERNFNLDKTKTYTLSFEHKGTAIAIKDDVSKETLFYTESSEEYVEYSYTFTNCSTIIFDIIRRRAGNGNACVKNFQLEIGTVATDYTKNKNEETLIDLNKYDENKNVIDNYEFASIDNVYDEFNITTGKLIKRIGKLVLDGSENWEMHYSEGTFYLRSNPLSNAKMPDNNTTVPNIICSHFKTDSYNNVWTNKIDNTIGVNNDGTSNPRIQFSQCKTAGELKVWLSSNPVTIYYELKEPIEINIEKTDVRLVSGTNNITIENDLKPNMIIKTDYLGQEESYMGTSIQIEKTTYEFNEISIVDNYFLYTEDLRKTAIINIWNRIKGFTYVDCKITSYTGKPYLKRGNKIKVQDDDGTYFDTYVLSHIFTYDGTFKSVIESPALTKTQTALKNQKNATSYFRRVERICNKIDGQLKDTIEQVNADGEKISDVTQTVADLTTTIEDNKYYIDENGNKVSISDTVYKLQQSTNGAISTISTTSGNNIFRNAIGLFKDEYWEGICKPYTDTSIQKESGQRSCWLLQNGNQKQTIELKNGHYTVSFIYKKLLQLATVSVKVNDEVFELTETEFTEFSKTIEIKENTLTIEFISNTDNACYILNLMGNAGDIAQPFSNNPNETVTDTVMIGKGLEISSNTMNTKLSADADGVRIKNASYDEVITEFTDKGIVSKDIETTGISKISGLLVMKVDSHIWLTGLE